MTFTPTLGEIYRTTSGALPTFKCGSLVKVIELGGIEQNRSDVFLVQLLFGEVLQHSFYHADKQAYVVMFEELEEITDAPDR